jgi:hypothetical protein
LVVGVSKTANEFLRQHEQTRGRFERVSRLLEGIESPAGLELLATVHWVKEHAVTTEKIIQAVHRRNQRKLHFT